MNNDKTLRLVGLTKSFEQGGHTLEILKGISLEVAPGEVVALTGSSGAGKSTLLQIAGLLDTPSGGEIHIAGHPCHTLDDGARTLLRREKLGFIYQFHHLLPEFTAAENVALPLMIGGMSKAKARTRAVELLESLNLGERASHRPSQLSGGEQQRVAILRAVASRPALHLADEPTGNLDEATAAIVFNELMDLAKSFGMGALIATHSLALAKQMDRTLHLHGGRLEDASPKKP